MRPLTKIGLAAAATLAAALVAQQLVPPADADQPLTLYVDRRIGADDKDGRTPDEPLRTLDAALELAEPGADILIMGYGDSLRYPGTGGRCITVRGTADKPITIRRNIYTNTKYPVFLSTYEVIEDGWRKEPAPDAEAGDPPTWSRAWPSRIRLDGDPDYGFLTIDDKVLTGYVDPPPADVDNAGWWADGRLYLRAGATRPNRHLTVVKDGDGLCLSGKSRHVRIKDLSIKGAVIGVRVEEGARDIGVEHVYRYSVLDEDLIPDSALAEGMEPPR